MALGSRLARLERRPTALVRWPHMAPALALLADEDVEALHRAAQRAGDGLAPDEADEAAVLALMDAAALAGVKFP